ncbi:J domain-containing protein [Pseudomonas sp. MYb118]|uniref:J domain-containing protein n=1 Tax=Pseudomonas sp. MYb118 TaxID=1848720 RepID=UPI0034CED989
MSCWTILGLEADADARSIKRQYAALLKVHRPDEDPSAFQRLREAYEQAMEWSRRAPVMASEPDVEAHGTLETEFDATPAGPNAAQLRAAQLLEDLTPEQLDQRLAQARVSHCTREFEEQLLMLCLQPRDDAMSLADWGMQQFNWLTMWQRQDLPAHALDLLDQAYGQAVKQRLREQLDAGLEDAFIASFLALKRADWLQPFDRHEWFNTTLAQVLVESPFWSSQVFETLCEQQHWKPQKGLPGRCPQPYWSMLEERHPYQAFLDEQRQLARVDDHDPKSRAAKLFFTPMTADERAAFARRFFAQDWNECRFLSERARRVHPQLCRELPDADPYFWKALMPTWPTWQVYVAFIAAALAWAAGSDGGKAGTVFEVYARAIPSAIMLTIIGAFVLALCRRVADRLWPLDVRLSRSLTHQLSFRKPAPLLLRDFVPCWLMAGFTAITCGAAALAAYAATLVALSALSRLRWPSTWRVSLPRPRLPKLSSAKSIVSMVLVIGLTVLFYVVARSQLMGPDQGLQPMATRACSGTLDSRVQCRPPATAQHWYGASSAAKVRP